MSVGHDSAADHPRREGGRLRRQTIRVGGLCGIPEGRTYRYPQSRGRQAEGGIGPAVTAGDDDSGPGDV